MGPVSYDLHGRKAVISLTVNAELFAQAEREGIDMSHIAEEALAKELARREAEALEVEIRRDLAAYNSYVEKHGSFAEMARGYRADGEPDDSV